MYQICTDQITNFFFHTMFKYLFLLFFFSGLEGWRLLQQVSQLKWTLLAKGQAVMNESELAALVLNMFIQMCHFYPSKGKF